MLTFSSRQQAPFVSVSGDVVAISEAPSLASAALNVKKQKHQRMLHAGKHNTFQQS